MILCNLPTSSTDYDAKNPNVSKAKGMKQYWFTKFELWTRYRCFFIYIFAWKSRLRITFHKICPMKEIFMLRWYVTFSHLFTSKILSLHLHTVYLHFFFLWLILTIISLLHFPLFVYFEVQGVNSHLTYLQPLASIPTSISLSRNTCYSCLGT